MKQISCGTKNKMLCRKRKTKNCGEGSQEDWISNLPESLICEILYRLPTKDAVKTSVLSTKWTSLWKLVPGLDLDSRAFSNLDAFVSFADRFIFDSPEVSWIRKIRLRIYHPFGSNYTFTSWIDAMTMRRIQHLDVDFTYPGPVLMPLSIYTCETLVHLRLRRVTLADAEVVSLPCLKNMQLGCIKYLNKAILEKLISSSPVLEDLTIVRLREKEIIQVRSQSLKRIHIDKSTPVEIDAPLLQCLRTKIFSTKKYKIINSGFPANLDIDVICSRALNSESMIHDILTDVSRVRNLVISSEMWKVIYSESRPLCQFRYISRLNARFCKSDLKLLPAILESCPKLESLILELVEERSILPKKNIQPKLLFSMVPRCLVSSLRFVELKRSISVYDGEVELVRYILMNSTILEKLTLDIYYAKNAKCAFLTELVAMPRCSSACEVIVI